jgi:hypothetical protein
MHHLERVEEPRKERERERERGTGRQADSREK